MKNHHISLIELNCHENTKHPYLCLGAEFRISIQAESQPHLIFTGKNGSGKTTIIQILFNALNHALHGQHIDFSDKGNKIAESLGSFLSKNLCNTKNVSRDGATITFTDELVYIQQSYNKGEFIYAYYPALRHPKFEESKTLFIDKSSNVSEVSHFLAFLTDIKAHQAFAISSGDTEEACKIQEWFDSFQLILAEIFTDPNLELDFNYRTYEWHIKSRDKIFKFNQLADGFAAFLNIVCDLMIKMHNQNPLVKFHKMPGIVFIDEIETHLHLELQQKILPFLIKVFPEIQFIVTTHSPLVLNSTPHTLAFDMDRLEIIDDLHKYSYEALAEGYFGIKTESGYLSMLLNEFKKLLYEYEELSEEEKIRLKFIYHDFKNIPLNAAPCIMGEFQKHIIIHSETIKLL